MKQQQIDRECQRFANLTGQRTIAVRTPDNLIRFQVQGWPVVGERLSLAEPEPQQAVA